MHNIEILLKQRMKICALTLRSSRQGHGVGMSENTERFPLI